MTCREYSVHRSRPFGAPQRQRFGKAALGLFGWRTDERRACRVVSVRCRRKRSPHPGRGWCVKMRTSGRVGRCDAIADGHSTRAEGGALRFGSLTWSRRFAEVKNMIEGKVSSVSATCGHRRCGSNRCRSAPFPLRQLFQRAWREAKRESAAKIATADCCEEER